MNVLIGQKSANLSHYHTLYIGHDGNNSDGGNNSIMTSSYKGGIRTLNTYGDELRNIAEKTGDIESRPNNFTVIIWKRTA